MPLQTSGPISIDDLRDYFVTGTGAQRLSDFYAGGGNVPAGCEGVNGPIPSSGTIQLRDFYGACINETDPWVDFCFDSGLGEENTVYFNDRSVGWSSVWSNGQSAFGDLSGGDPINPDGWGIASFVLINEYVIPFRYSYLINFDNASYLSYEYDVTTQEPGGASESFTTQSTQVSDSVIEVNYNYSGGKKDVRSILCQFGSWEGYYVDEWLSGEVCVNMEVNNQ
jgi:hypothetical protein